MGGNMLVLDPMNHGVFCMLLAGESVRFLLLTLKKTNTVTTSSANLQCSPATEHY